MQATLAAPRHPAAARGLKRPPHTDPALHLACHGWTSFSNHLSEREVEAMRRAIESAFASPALQPEVLSPYGCGGILLDLLRLPAIASLLFTRETMDRLAEAVGPGFVLLPEHAAHREGFGGWHKDTDMFEAAGLHDHWREDYAVFQCAIYLQDNTPVHGGGLSCVDGSHLDPKPDPRLGDAATRYQAHCEREGRPIESAAGDLVIFHTRLDHRATPRQVPAAGQPKLAVFFMAARDNAHAAAYSEFIHRRQDYTYLSRYRVPEELQQLARTLGFRWGT